MRSTEPSPFDAGAREYDAWYDSAYGAAVLRAEVECLQPLLDGRGPTVEVGAGSGRFCAALGGMCGLDPSRAMLEIAAARGLHVIRGVGEALPFRDGSLGHVLFVATLEFVEDPSRALREAARVLRRDGSLAIGLLSASSPWAE